MLIKFYNNLNTFSQKYFNYENMWQSLGFALLIISLFNFITCFLLFVNFNTPIANIKINVDYLLIFVFVLLLFKILKLLKLANTRVMSFVLIFFFFLLFSFDISRVILRKFNFESNVFFIANEFDNKNPLFVLKLYYDNLISNITTTSAQGFLLLFTAAFISFLIILILYKRSNKLINAAFYGLLFFNASLLIFYYDSLFIISASLLPLFVISAALFFDRINQGLARFNNMVLLYLLAVLSFAFVVSNDLDDEKNYFSNTTDIFSKFSIHEKNISSATENIFKLIEDNEIIKYDNIIIIIVESYGDLKDEDTMKDFYSVLDDDEKLKSKYKLERGLIDYRGYTKTAEFRELCKYQTLGVPSKADVDKINDCLPNKFNKLGYATTGIHNSAATNFRRKEWYPLMNFKNIFFEDDLKKLFDTNNICGGSFEGICEKDMFSDVLPKILSANDKNFLYFLTVESHIPAFKHEMSKEFEAKCSKHEILKRYEQFCWHYDLQYKLLKYVSKIATDFGDKKNYIVMVGDHNPPFLRAEYANKFKLGKVPYVRLISK